jgi:hypothetical protein
MARNFYALHSAEGNGALDFSSIIGQFHRLREQG